MIEKFSYIRAVSYLTILYTKPLRDITGWRYKGGAAGCAERGTYWEIDHMADSDLEGFISCYNMQNHYDRPVTWSENNPGGHWCKFSMEEILEREKTSLDIFRIKYKCLADLDILPTPDILADDIIEFAECFWKYFRS